MSNVHVLFDARERLRKVLVEASIEITDSGMLMDEDRPRADLGVKIEGQQFSLQMSLRGKEPK